MSRGLVSVIVTCFNYGHFLEEAVRSVLTQSYSNFEIIIVDDGSSDQTPEIGHRLAAEDHRIRFFRTTNRGVSAARNYGLSLARGEYLTALDADDSLYPWSLESLVRRLEEDPRFGFSYGCLDMLGALPGEPVRWVPGPFSAPLMRIENLSSVTGLWRRSLYEQNVKFRENFFFEDWDLWLQIVERGYVGGYVTKPILRCRVHLDGRTSVAKFFYYPALAQQASANRRLFHEPSFETFHKNVLFNAPGCFKKPTAMFLLPVTAPSMTAYDRVLPVMKSFIEAGHLVVAIGSMPKGIIPLAGLHAIDVNGVFQFYAVKRFFETCGANLIVCAQGWDDTFLRMVKRLQQTSLLLTLDDEVMGASDYIAQLQGNLLQLHPSICASGHLEPVYEQLDDAVVELSDIACTAAALKIEAARANRAVLSRLAVKEYRGAPSGAGNPPSVTVVIPSRNVEIVRMQRCLHSIRSNQSFRTIPIIVSDYGSTTDNLTELARLCSRYDAQLVSAPTRRTWSRARALNLGARHATTEWLVFTDSDTIFSPDLLAMWSDYTQSLDGPRIFLSQAKKLAPIANLCLDPNAAQFAAISEKGRPMESNGRSALHGIRREHFEAMRGFNENYEVWGCADRDLTWRAELLGFELTWLQPGHLLHQWHLKDVPESLLSDNLQRCDEIVVGLTTHANGTDWGSVGQAERDEVARFGLLPHPVNPLKKDLEHQLEKTGLPPQQIVALLLSWGRRCISDQQWESAHETFLDVIALDPENTSALLGLAICYHFRGSSQLAAHYAYRVLELDDGNAQARELLQIHQEKTGGYYSYVQSRGGPLGPPSYEAHRSN